MNALVGPRRLSGRALLAVALLAIATRVAYEVRVRGDAGPVGTLARHLQGDECAYDRTARQFAAGTLQREHAFYQEPLYPFALSLAYRAAPPPPLPPDAAALPMAPVHEAIIDVQHGLGVLTCLLVALLGARALGPRVGLLAGLFAALSGPMIFTEAQLIKEAPALLVWTASLHVWMDLLQDRGGAGRAALLGLLLGVGILLRGNTWLLLGMAVVSLLLLRVGERRRVGRAALVAGCALIALLPVTIFNVRRGDFVLSTYQSGTNAAIGMPDNDSPTAGLAYEPLRIGRGDAIFEESDAIALAEAAEGHRLSGPEISRFWWRRAAHVALQRPLVAAQRVLRKVAATFHPDEVPDVKDWTFFKQAVPELSTPLSDLTVLGPLALIGLLLLPWRCRRLLVVRASVLAVTLTLALFYVMGRYRLSAAPGLWILAAGILVAGARLLRAPVRAADAADAPSAAGAARTPSLARKVGVVLLAAVAIAAGQVPLRPESGSLPTSWSNLGSVELADARAATDAAAARADRDAAEAAAREAVQLAPLAPEAHALLLDTLDLETPLVAPLTDEGDAEAVRLLLAVEGRRVGRDTTPLQSRPRDEELAAAATILKQPGLPGMDETTSELLAKAARRVARSVRDGPYLPFALNLVDEALAVQPNEPGTLVDKGVVLKRLGRLQESEAAYRAALKAGADTLEVNNNLGNLLLRLKRPAEAMPFFERALVLEPGNAIVLQNIERTKAAIAGR